MQSYTAVYSNSIPRSIPQISVFHSWKWFGNTQPRYVTYNTDAQRKLACAVCTQQAHTRAICVFMHGRPQERATTFSIMSPDDTSGLAKVFRAHAH